MTTRLNERAQVRLVWLVAVFATILGYVVVWQPRQAELSAIDARAHDLYERANANEDKVRRASQLRSIEDRVNADLAHLAGQNSSAKAAANTITLLDREAQLHHLDVRSIVPEAANAADSQDALLGEPVTLGIRGAFRDLVVFLADMPRHNVLIDVGSVELVTLDRTKEAHQPTLDATIHITLYRVKRNGVRITEEPHGAATAAR